MKLYTRTGDDGTTSLFDGTRVRKDHARVAAYGDVDEVNGCIGLAIVSMPTTAGWNTLRERLTRIQSELFTVGADLATPTSARQRAAVPTVTDAHVATLEQWIDDACAASPPLKSFVLPGGCEQACRLHAVRATARRAERSVVSLASIEPISAHVVEYLNRLNDLLFAWARQANVLAGVPDVPWHAPDAT